MSEMNDWKWERRISAWLDAPIEGHGLYARYKEARELLLPLSNLDNPRTVLANATLLFECVETLRRFLDWGDSPRPLDLPREGDPQYSELMERALDLEAIHELMTVDA